MDIPHSTRVPYTSADFPHTDWENGPSLSRGLAERSLPEVRASVAAAYPERIAVVEHGPNARRWTHRTLDFLVKRWAARLAREGVTAGTPIGLCAEAELEVPVGFLAILEAGGIVVPLDPSLPPGRLRAMAEGAGCGLVLGSDTTSQALAGSRIVSLSRDPGDSPPRPVPSDSERAAAIFYTSGSTGRPKPVVLSHRALSARILSMIEWFGIAADEVVCAASSLAFDPFLQQLFFPICTGGTLWLPERLSLLDPDRFWAEAAEHGVTHLNLVPSQLEPLLRRPPTGGLATLRRVVVGGERMPPDMPSRIAAAVGRVAIYNMYGPTEATVDATGHRADPTITDRDVPIGKPLPGCRVRILDERLQRVPIGTPGELFIGGAGLAIGYLGMPEETAESFLLDPFGDPGDRLYRTGDSACWLPSGEIAFLSRRDDQVKIRGQRIEIGEVEAALRAFPGVSAAAVGKWDDAPGGPALIGYLAGTAEPTELRAWLAERLPAAAVPVRLMHMESLPALPSGKIDRRALPVPALASPSAHCGTPSMEHSIAAVWAGLLGLSTVDVSTNLFEMGAHSLHIPQALAAIEASTGKPLHAVDIFRYPTVASLARYLSGEQANVPASPDRATGAGEIAIIGMAFRFPGASDCETFWANLLAGTDYVRHFDSATLRDRAAPACLLDHPDFVPAHAAIDNTDRFDPVPFGYSPGEAAGIDPQQRLLLELAWHALEDAACDPAAEGPVGVFAGVGFNAYLVDNLRGQMGFAGGPDRFSTVVGSDKDFAATRIAYKLGLTGPALTVNSACSTALSATAMAVDSLRAGRCRVALAGACSLGMFSPFGHIYAEGGIASRTGVCRPFDSLADGIVGGAGAAVLALKRLEDAIGDGSQIYGVIRGIGIANDGGQKAAFSAPSVDGQAAAIAAALADAGVSPEDIGFVEGHGTGTALGDPIEVAALNLIFRGRGSGEVLLGSVKGNVGHLDAAAGMAGLIKAVLAVRHGTVPSTAHFAAPNPRIPFADGPFRVNTAAEPWPGPPQHPRLAGVSAFGMGGTNIHVIVGPPPEAPPPTPSGNSVLLTISAATTAAREQLAANLSAHADGTMAGVASSLARRRPMRYRRARVAIFTVDGEASGGALTAAFLFPGQGAQRPGMASELYRAIPAFRAVLDAAEAIVGRDLLSLLLTDGGKAAAAALSETEHTQPALFLMEFAMAKALQAFGVRPAALLGHSIGEYVAACLAGVMEFEDALRLVTIRGRLMASAPRGAMLAVSLPEADLLPLLAQSGADLAAVNGARQCVASGTETQIGALAQLVAAAVKPSTRLAVSHAFHSALMDPILDAFAAEAAKIRLSPPAIPIVSNLSGDWLSPEEATDPAYWARHLRGTVRFATGLHRLSEDPSRLLVEAGPGTTLTNLARGAGVAEARAIATQPPGSADGHAAFLGALGRLWVAGMPVDRLAAAGNASRRVSLPGYPFERVRLWIDPGGAATAEPAPAVAPIRKDLPLRPDSTATVIADIWRDLLGVAACGPDDDFLALGGDSLIAVRIAARLRQRLGCDVAPSAVFREGTVGGLARLLSSVQAVPVPERREEGWL